MSVSCFLDRCHVDQVDHTINCAECLFKDVSSRRRYHEFMKSNSIRQESIKWIIKAARSINMSFDVLETSIQIHDQFMLKVAFEAPSILSEQNVLSLIAAACLLLSSKMNKSDSSLTTAAFPQFSCKEVIAWERTILQTIDFCIIPTATSTFQINYLLGVWKWCDVSCGHLLQDTALGLVASFITGPEYLLYAPSTIAFAALLVAFLHLEIDHSEWLRCVPEDIYCTSTSMAFRGLDPSDRMQLLDVGGCLQCFQGLIAQSKTQPLIATSLEVDIETLAEDSVTTPVASLQLRQDHSPVGVVDLYGMGTFSPIVPMTKLKE